jgi:hypothetical protein
MHGSGKVQRLIIVASVWRARMPGPSRRRQIARAAGSLAVVAAALVTGSPSGNAAAARTHSGDGGRFDAGGGRLLLSRTVYTAPASSIVPGVTQLPAGCTSNCVTAVADGGYPEVFNNESVDPSFGVSSPIRLDSLRPDGRTLTTITVPDRGNGAGYAGDHLVTSFPSKSELALNPSTDGRSVAFVGYVAPVNAPDVSNSNTPGVTDPTNPVGTAYYRGVAQLDADGRLTYTETNAYSGNNGRAAILNSADGVYYTAGNAGNGANPQPAGVIAGAGTQILAATHAPQSAQVPGSPTPVGSFNITQLGDKADKIGKDTNFRGLSVYNNVVYLTKGSGGNGVNTVYFIDTTGTACPNGVGLPVAGAPLPTAPISYDPATVQTTGLHNNMCILKGFPTALKSTTSFPFGLWFANPTTLYVADEGNGDTTYDPDSNTFTNAAAQTGAGLQKWVLANGTWTLAYTIQNGLGLGTPYTVVGYPAGVNSATGLRWAPATDGLRNITGHVNADGTATIWAITSTVSGATDTGADPNRLVAVTDSIGATTPAANTERGTGRNTDTFTTLRTAVSGQALRGITYLPLNSRRRALPVPRRGRWDADRPPRSGRRSAVDAWLAALERGSEAIH